MSYAYNALNLGMFLLGLYLILRGVFLYYGVYKERKRIRRQQLGDFAGHEEWKKGTPNDPIAPHARPINSEYFHQRNAR